MKPIGIGLLTVCASLGLSGCIIVVSDDEPDGVHWATEYDEVRDEHHRARSDAAQALLDDIRAGFDQDEYLRDEGILIAAKDGVVTLSGEASSVEIVDRAVGIARHTGGVRSVVSRVVVVVDN